MDFLDFAGNDGLKARLRGQLSGRGLSHAYILSGPKGTGKHTLARILTQAFLCEGEGDRRPCGSCPHCRKVRSGIHPDVSVIGGDGDVPVKEMRLLRGDVFIRPNEGHRKVYLFEEAQKLSRHSQNVLLKLLEEGPRYAAFLFLTDEPEALLQTVRSRCEILSLTPVSHSQAQDYLSARFSDRAPPEIDEAARHCQGALGLAVEKLEGAVAADPQIRQKAAELVDLLCHGRELDLGAFAVELEAYKREMFLAFLQEAQAMLQALLLDGAANGPGAGTGQVPLSGGQIMGLLNIIHQLSVQCKANVGVGHCAGLLAVACWEAMGR